MNIELRFTALQQSPWHMEEVDGGVLCINDGYHPDARTAEEMVRTVASGDFVPASLDVLSTHGTSAKLYRSGGLAVKAFNNTDIDRAPINSGLPFLRASVALQEGLVSIADSIPPEYRRYGSVECQYTAPEMLASFIPRRDNLDQQPVTIMECMPGEDLLTTRILYPPVSAREAVQRMALHAAGVELTRGDLCINPRNTLIHRPSETAIQITRLDLTGSHRSLARGLPLI